MEAPAPTQGLLEGMDFPIPTKIERISKKQILVFIFFGASQLSKIKALATKIDSIEQCNATYERKNGWEYP